MTALILISPSEMTAPYPDTPYLPDIESQLLSLMDANSLTGAEDDPSLWPQAEGSPLYGFGSASANSADTAKHPTLKLTAGRHGGKALKFTASLQQRLVNASGGSIDLGMPFTAAFRVKMTEGISGTQSLLTGSSGAAYMAIQMTSAGNFVALTPPSPGGDSLTSSGNGTEWQTVIVVFNGTNSMLMVEGKPPVTGDLGVTNPAGAKLAQLRMGGNTAGASAFPDMLIDRVAFYGRALTLTDCEGLIAEWQ